MRHQLPKPAAGTGAAPRSALVYYVFDLPYAEGYQLLQTPLVERKALLAKTLNYHEDQNDGTVRYSDYVRGQGPAVLKKACEAHTEGIVSKRADSAYEQRRSRAPG